MIVYRMPHRNQGAIGTHHDTIAERHLGLGQNGSAKVNEDALAAYEIAALLQVERHVQARHRRFLRQYLAQDAFGTLLVRIL